MPRLRDDISVRAVVIAGVGGHFCAGADIKLLAEAQSGPRDVFEGRERIGAGNAEHVRSATNYGSYEKGSPGGAFAEQLCT